MTTPQSVPPDVRMRGFARRTSVGDALTWLDQQWTLLDSEVVPLSAGFGRVMAKSITSTLDVPSFPRSMMDGYAVVAKDTLGATAYNRLPFRCVGQSMPGAAFRGKMKRGEVIRIMTGAPMPTDADAVLPAERTIVESDQVFATDAVSPGKNVGQCGEDIRQGTVVIRKGRCLRPQDLGILSSIGLADIPVIRTVRVRCVTTGNELAAPGTRPGPYQVTDSNSPMLAALVRRDGGVVSEDAIVPDSPEAILKAMQDDVDVVLVSGGSSVGQEDHAPRLLAENGELSIHGLAMRPSSPAGMGRLGHRLVFLLPGNPVSCLCAYDFFAGRAIRGLAGLPRDWPYSVVLLPLKRKLVSVIGRLDYARVSIVDGAVEPLAIAGASVLSSTSRADGFVLIPEDSEGYAAGKTVVVYQYDRWSF